MKLDCMTCTRYGKTCQVCREWQVIKIIRK
jgi:hypothetical protein